MEKGRIIKSVAGFYYVDVGGDRVYECRPKGIFRKQGIKPLTGDMVDISITHEGDMEGQIEAIEKRKSILMRPPVANVDQALLIFAIRNPRINTGLLDRFLVWMESQGIPTILCINKTDLLKEDEEESALLAERYRDIGYKVIETSALLGDGRSEVLRVLSGHVTAVAGPSGVGKSSLINLLQDSVVMETGELMKKQESGKQTTRHCELIFVPEADDYSEDREVHSYIIDTPGFGSVEFNHIEASRLGDFFPEIAARSMDCRFSGCAHIHEPDCAVRGHIDPDRYDHYVQLYGEIEERKDHR